MMPARARRESHGNWREALGLGRALRDPHVKWGERDALGFGTLRIARAQECRKTFKFDGVNLKKKSLTA